MITYDHPKGQPYGEPPSIEDADGASQMTTLERDQLKAAVELLDGRVGSANLPTDIAEAVALVGREAARTVKRYDLAGKGAATAQQPGPQGEGPEIFRLLEKEIFTSGIEHSDRIVADLLARREFGVEKYGGPLRAFNGRDAHADTYQEALDAVYYSRQGLEEGMLPGLIHDLTIQLCSMLIDEEV